MEYRFFKDADTGLSHCQRHGVSEREVIEVLQRRAETLRRHDGTMVAQGQTLAGRYLLVVYREFPEYIFVITAYELIGNAKRAFRRRRRRR